MARILVTGAAGFVGRALCQHLAARGHSVVAGVRDAAKPVAGAESCPLGRLGPDTDWACALTGVEIVVHLAQRAHRHVAQADVEDEPATAVALARAASGAGARRLVFLSSIKAMGECTVPGRPFRAAAEPFPQDSYGRRKLATERALAIASAESGIQLTVIRPPLVYGPGVGANFRALLRLVASGVPLPFAAIDNRRSLIFIDNLIDATALAAFHPAAAGEVLLVGDGEDLSTPALIGSLAAAFGRRPRLFALPEPFFAVGRRLPAIGPALASLTLSAQLDDGPTRQLLGWRPPVPAAAGIAATVAAFRPES
jgi:nucleoside-diphosphate-sugar epimerase